MPTPQSAPGGVTRKIPTTSAAPVSQSPTPPAPCWFRHSKLREVCNPPCPPSQPTGPMPTPQGALTSTSKGTGEILKKCSKNPCPPENEGSTGFVVFLPEELVG